MNIVNINPGVYRLYINVNMILVLRITTRSIMKLNVNLSGYSTAVYYSVIFAAGQHLTILNLIMTST